MEWLDWLADACFSLPGVLGFHPLPGTRQHRELSLRARREYNEERFKPAEQRDPERVRQLRIQDLRLGIEEGEVNPLLAPFAAAAQQWRWSCPALHHRWPHAIQFTAMQFRVACLELKFREWQAAAARAACCAGSKCAHRRLAASCAARARFYRVRARQAQEELSAALERRPIRIVELARIELPARVVEEMRGVPATDLCAACHTQLELVSLRAVWECGSVGELREGCVVDGTEGRLGKPAGACLAARLNSAVASCLVNLVLCLPAYVRCAAPVLGLQMLLGGGISGGDAETAWPSCCR